MIRLLLSLTAVLMISGCAVTPDSSEAPPSRPNVVIILADDLGFGDLSCYAEASLIRTPHLDRLAAQGIRFTDAHAPSAVCTPTRYGLLTGRYCWRTRLKRSVLMGFSAALIEPGRMTLATMLSDLGYATACIGKWHLGLDWMRKDGKRVRGAGPRDGTLIDFSVAARGGPIDHGFDRFFGCAACPTTDWIYAFLEGDRTIGQPTEKRARRPGPRGQSHMLDLGSRRAIATPGWDHSEVDVRFVEEARHWLDRHHAATPDRPFFLYLPLSAPHAPWLPPAHVRGTSDEGPRGDMVKAVDWAVGRIDEKLRQLGISDDTLVIFTSDNGPRVGLNGHRSAGPWRGYKSHAWEGGHRVPLIVRWPGVVPPDTRTDAPASLVDLAATCAAIVGHDLSPAEAPDSLNLLPVLLGQDARPRRIVLSHSVRGAFTIRIGPWKLILGTEGSGGWVPPSDQRDPEDWNVGQLYHLEDDPGERDNLFHRRPDVVDRLRRALRETIDDGRSRPSGDALPQPNPGARP